MATRFSISFKYEVAYSPEHVRAVLEALDRAVTENWREDAYVWSGPVPPDPVRIDEWLVEADSDKLYDFSLPTDPSWMVRPSVPLWFNFSPMSHQKAELLLEKKGDGLLRVSVVIFQDGLRPDESQAAYWYYERHFGLEALMAEADEEGRRRLGEFSYFVGEAIGDWIVARRAQWAEWGRGVFDFELIARRHWDHLKRRLSEALPVEHWSTYDPSGSHSGTGPWTPPEQPGE